MIERLVADDPAAIARAAAAIARGELVVFPTDTLYGVAADPFDAAAINRLYQAKRRPASKGLPILISDPKHLARFIDGQVPPAVSTLMARFWPGALTLVLPRRRDLPANLSPNANIAVRMPALPAALAFIDAAGGGLAVSSANRSSEPPAHNAAMALDAFDDEVAIVLDGGESPVAVASTVLDCTVQPFRILRSGPISADALSLSEASR